MRSLTILLALLSLNLCSSAAAEKPRVFVLTDIENEPDDAMSMVRCLTYANHFDIEGLAATTSIHQQNRVAPDRIRMIVEAYGKVRDNLEQHEKGYTLSGTLSAVAGLIMTSRLDSAQPNAGTGYELDSIAAVVVGGTSLSGGRGTIFGTIIGCLIIGVLNSGLVLLNVSPFWQQVVKGGVILVAVAIDRMRESKD